MLWCLSAFQHTQSQCTPTGSPQPASRHNIPDLKMMSPSPSPRPIPSPLRHPAVHPPHCVHATTQPAADTPRCASAGSRAAQPNGRSSVPQRAMCVTATARAPALSTPPHTATDTDTDTDSKRHTVHTYCRGTVRQRAKMALAEWRPLQRSPAAAVSRPAGAV